MRKISIFICLLMISVVPKFITKSNTNMFQKLSDLEE